MVEPQIITTRLVGNFSHVSMTIPHTMRKEEGKVRLSRKKSTMVLIISPVDTANATSIAIQSLMIAAASALKLLIKFSSVLDGVAR